MCDLGRHDQAIVSHECLAGRPDPFFSIRCQWKLSGAGMSAVQRPFGLPMTDDKDSGCSHCGWRGSNEEQKWSLQDAQENNSWALYHESLRSCRGRLVSIARPPNIIFVRNLSGLPDGGHHMTSFVIQRHRRFQPPISVPTIS